MTYAYRGSSSTGTHIAASNTWTHKNDTVSIDAFVFMTHSKVRYYLILSRSDKQCKNGRLVIRSSRAKPRFPPTLIEQRRLKYLRQSITFTGDNASNIVVVRCLPTKLVGWGRGRKGFGGGALQRSSQLAGRTNLGPIVDECLK